MKFTYFLMAFALLIGVAFALTNGTLTLNKIGTSKTCDAYSTEWQVIQTNASSHLHLYVVLNGTLTHINDTGNGVANFNFKIIFNQNNTISYDYLNGTSGGDLSIDSVMGQKANCNATDTNCSYYIFTNMTGATVNGSSLNVTMPLDFGSTLYESCPPATITNEYFRNGTASNVSLIPHNMTSQAYSCYVNATTPYSSSSKNLTGLNNTTTAYFNFLAVTEVANLTEQEGSATCNLSNGTAITIYDSAGIYGQSTWLWVYMLDYWEVASLRGERRQVTSSPATRYAGTEIKGVYYRLVSIYDGLDNVGQLYQHVALDYNDSRCSMDNPDAYYNVQPIEIDGKGVYYIDFTHGGTDAGLLCTDEDNVTINITTWKNIWVKNFGMDPDVNQTEINFSVERQDLIFDNVQGVFEDPTNESGPADYWFTVSTAYNRDPVLDDANMSCNMTVGSTEYVGVEQRDYNPSGTLIFTHFYFDANDTNGTLVNYSINCEADGNYIAAGSLTKTGRLTYAHYLTRVFMCKLLDTDKYNPSTIWFKGSKPTVSMATNIVCYVQPDGEKVKVLNYAPEKELLNIYTTNSTGEWALDIKQNLNDNYVTSYPYVVNGQYQMTSGGIYFYIANNAIFSNKVYGVDQPFNDGDVFNSYVGRLHVFKYDDAGTYDFGNFSTTAVLSVEMKQVYDLYISPITMTIMGHNATDTEKYSYVDYNNSIKCSLNVYNPGNLPVSVNFVVTDDSGIICQSNVNTMQTTIDNASAGYYTYSQIIEKIGYQAYCNNSNFISRAEKGSQLLCGAKIIFTENGETKAETRKAGLPMKFAKDAVESGDEDWAGPGGSLGGLFSWGIGWIDDLTTYFLSSTDNALKVVIGGFVMIALMPIIYWLATGFLGNKDNRR